ncbi:MAG: thermosome subunit beta [Candidatus Helarchaeota archaeon]
MEKKKDFSEYIIKKGNEAKKNITSAVLAISELLKSSLGPLGMRKMIIEKYGTIIISNDGLTIIKDIGAIHPVAISLIQLGKSFVNNVGDGLKSTILIIGELLQKGTKLLKQNIHPTQIIYGYDLALKQSINKLKELAIPINRNDKKQLLNIAKNALNGKFSKKVIEHLADIAAQAVQAIVNEKNGIFEIDIDNDIQFLKMDGGGILDTKIINGILLSKEILNPKMPKKVRDAKIALIDEKLYFEKQTEEDFKVELDIQNIDFLSNLKKAQNNVFQRKFEIIINSGANVVITEKGIDKFIISKLVEHGILTIRRAKPEQFKMLSKACNAKIIGNTDDLKTEDLGYASKVEEIIIGKNKIIKIEGCKNPRPICILIRGGSWYVCEEVERLLKNAILSVSQLFNNTYSGIVGGGGAIEMEIASNLKNFARSLTGKVQIIVNLYGNALEIIPKTLARNAGLDPINIITNLRHLHSRGDTWKGLNLNTLKIANTTDLGIVEPLFRKVSALKYATEFVNYLLKIDYIYISKGGLEKIKRNR